jgi:hypothetical protein
MVGGVYINGCGPGAGCRGRAGADACNNREDAGLLLFCDEILAVERGAAEQGKKSEGCCIFHDAIVEM